MNNQLIEKVIKSSDGNACPEFAYENPLLDRKVAGALTRSFVNIFRISQQDSNINNNLRHSVLANIRKLCRIEPESHLEIDENFANSLSEMYMKEIREKRANNSFISVYRYLDDFLLRRMKEIDLNSHYNTSMNPEVVQALLNLSENCSRTETITKNVLHWNMTDKKNFTLVKNLWSNPSLTEASYTTEIIDDLSIKMKSEIEVILLSTCHSILTDPNIQIHELFIKCNILSDLVMKCSKSPECFQICSRILNYIFVNTNFNIDIQHLVSIVIQMVKESCSNCISELYPMHLSNVVVLLDINLNILPLKIRSKYVEKSKLHLENLDDKMDLFMLLSHYPQWFDIYNC